MSVAAQQGGGDLGGGLLSCLFALGLLEEAGVVDGQPGGTGQGRGQFLVLVGARLLPLPPADSLLPEAFVLGVSAVSWAFCAWLIPFPLALGVWRHVLRRVPPHYETSLWSMVFPVGMYGVATRELGDAAD